jgi:hypothetical protein
MVGPRATPPTGYTVIQGTSFSCPLTAGVAALLVKEHPAAAPMTIVNAMKSTASKAGSPDNLMGYGILNAVAARIALGSTDTNGLPPVEGGDYHLGQNYPNPFNPGTWIEYSAPREANVTLTIYDLIGRKVRTLVSGTVLRGIYRTEWNGRDDRGTDVAAGVYIYRLTAAGIDGGQSVINRKLLLLR